jgi:hypothetical protein
MYYSVSKPSMLKWVRHASKGSFINRWGSESSIDSSIMFKKEHSLVSGGCWKALKMFSLTFIFPIFFSIIPVLQFMHTLVVAKIGRPRITRIILSRLGTGSVSRTTKSTRK